MKILMLAGLNDLEIFIRFYVALNLEVSDLTMNILKFTAANLIDYIIC